MDYSYPQITASNPSVGTNGITAPLSSTEIGGVNPSGNLAPLQVDTNGALIVSPLTSASTVTVVQPNGANLHVTVDASALPTGAATAGNQATEITALQAIQTNTANIPPQGQALAGASLPVVLPASQITALTPPTTVTVIQPTGSNLHVSVDSSALPTGAATSALQSNVQSAVGTSATTAITIQGSASGVAIPVSVSSSALPSGAATAGNQATEIGYLTTIATNTTGVTVAQGSTTAGQSGQLVQGAVSASSPTYAAGQTDPLSLTTAGALRVDASATTQPTSSADSAITGAAAQTTAGNNALLATAGTGWLSVAGYKSATVQVVSTGTAGTYIFECSNDGVNAQTLPVFNQLILTGTPITAAITATASQLIYHFPAETNYIRLRIATAITGGSIQAFTRLSQTTWTPQVTQVAQSTAANLTVTASGTVTSNQGTPAAIANSWYAKISDGSNGPAAVKAASTAAAATDPSLVIALSPNSPLPTGTNTIGAAKITDGTNTAAVKAASTAAVATDSSLVVQFSPNSAPKAPVNLNGSGSSAGATVSTVTTLTAPSNAVGFYLMCLDTSTANIRWAIGRTATTTLGQQLQPGRDTGLVPCGANVSIVAESGTQNYDIQWVSQ